MIYYAIDYIILLLFSGSKPFVAELGDDFPHRHGRMVGDTLLWFRRTRAKVRVTGEMKLNKHRISCG